MAGCQNAISASDAYTFPEQAAQLAVSRSSQGAETSFVIELDEYDSDDLSAIPVIEWFYGLELRECEEPEPVEGKDGIFNAYTR